MALPKRWRKHARLPTASYTHGYFFVTVVTAWRRPILTGAAAEALRAIVVDIPRRFPGWSVDTFELMPDHFHLILAADEAGHGLGQVVGAVKSLFFKWRRDHGFAHPVWQRNYYERIIRTDRELANYRRYIIANPWVTEVDWNKVPDI